jgi:tungstate transport system ATP-binding protein
MNEASTHITFGNIHKRFGKRHVLNGANLELQGGQCSLLTGPNGSGKTTLLLICAGLDRPDQAELNLGSGMLPWKRCRKSLLKKTVYLHQQPYMFDGSVIKNLGYGLPKHLSKKERDTLIDRGLEWAELEPIADAHAKSLSGGEKQRVALARAWLRNPDIMLLDEPTANMDQMARQRSHELIQRLKEEGMALLVASHDPAHFISEADHCLALKNGHIHQEQVSGLPLENITPIHANQKVIYGNS